MDGGSYEIRSNYQTVHTGQILRPGTTAGTGAAPHRVRAAAGGGASNEQPTIGRRHSDGGLHCDRQAHIVADTEPVSDSDGHGNTQSDRYVHVHDHGHAKPVLDTRADANGDSDG